MCETQPGIQQANESPIENDYKLYWLCVDDGRMKMLYVVQLVKAQ
jgi:hypothetical protein